MIRSLGTAAAVFTLVGLLTSPVCASVDLSSGRAGDDVASAVSPAYASPAFVAAQPAQQLAFEPIAMFASAPSAVTADEATQWGLPDVIPHHHVFRHLTQNVVSRTASIAESLTRSAMRFIGTPYVFGGTSVYGFDCSGYVQHVFAMLGKHIPRTADAQYYAGKRIQDHVAKGDLVFFQTYEPGPSHVGIYLGEGKFVHASSHGVMVSSLSEHYWRVRYLGAKRLLTINT